jgi:hypothetical protein
MNVSFLLSARQLCILSAILLAPHRSFSLTELADVAGPGHGATQRYLQQLLEAQVLAIESAKRPPRYQANIAHPIFQELCNICRKANNQNCA